MASRCAKALALLAAVCLLLLPGAAALACVDGNADGVAGLDQLPPPSRSPYQALAAVPGPNPTPNSGFLASVRTNADGTMSPACHAFQIDGGLVTTDLFGNAGFTPFSADDIQEIDIIATQAPEASGAVINVITRSNGAAKLVSGQYDYASGGVSNWSEYDLTDGGPLSYLSGAGRDVDGQGLASVMGSGEEGTTLWRIPGDLNLGEPIIKDKIWFFGTWAELVKNKPVAHAYDSQGFIQGVGVSQDGCLVHTKWDADTSALEGGQIGDCGQDWRWPQVGVGPGDHLWVSAYNGSAGNLQIFEKSPGGDWSQTVITPTEGNTVGMYNSMWVDQITGTAQFTYAFSGGRTKTLKKSPGGEAQWTWLDEALGQANAAATVTHDGYSVHWWSSPQGDDASRLFYRSCPTD